MKFKKIFLVLISALITLSCKNENQNHQNENQNDSNKVPTNTFKVIVNVIVKKNDDFCLLYTQDGSLNFTDGVWKEIKGLDNEQSVEFSLPEDVFPTQLRLDLGRNVDQDDILIKSVKFDYIGNVRELVGPQIGVFFRADASKCTYDSSTGIVKALIKDNVKQSPSLYPHESIQAVELPKLIK